MDSSLTQAILDTAHNAFVSMDAEGRVRYWNPRAAEMFGWSTEEAVGRELSALVIPERLRTRHQDGLRRFLATGEGPVLGRRIELSALRRDGGEFPIEITISALDEGDHWSFHAFVQDITDRRRGEEERSQLMARVAALARTDELTGLPNRRAWDEEVRREVSRSRRHGHRLSIALIDLDRFKDYNDAYGHLGGDHLLRTMAANWRLVLRVTDFIARYGGEEFALLLPECPPHSAVEVLDRLCRAVPDSQTFSAGTVIWDGQESIERLTARADEALYAAKAHGRDKIVAHTHDAQGPAPSGPEPGGAPAPS